MIGAARIRHLAGFDVLFVVAPEDGELAILIGAIKPPRNARLMKDLLKTMGTAAMLRGATGV